MWIDCITSQPPHLGFSFFFYQGEPLYRISVWWKCNSLLFSLNHDLSSAETGRALGVWELLCVKLVSPIARHTSMGSPSRKTPAFQVPSSKMFLVMMFSVSGFGRAAILQIPFPSFLTWCCHRGPSLLQTHSSHPCDCGGNYISIKLGGKNPEEKLCSSAHPQLLWLGTLCCGLFDVVVFSQEFNVLGGLFLLHCTPKTK